MDTDALESFITPLGVGLLIGGLATIGVHVAQAVDSLVGPTGGRLLSISGIIDLPSALCLLLAVLVLLSDWRQTVRALARWVSAATGLVLMGLMIAGYVGVIDLATPQNGRGPILKALDAASYGVGFLTFLALAGVFCALAFRGEKEAV